MRFKSLKRLVGERGFEPPTPWSRTWGHGADFVVIQSFEWCFNRLSLAESRQFWRNVNPPSATLARVSCIRSPVFRAGGAIRRNQLGFRKELVMVSRSAK